MTTNTHNNIAMITKRAMNVLRNNLVLLPRVNRTYEAEFNKGQGKIGDTINVRVPSLGGTVVDGKVASPDGYQDSYKAVTVAQKNTSLSFTSKELALNLEDDVQGGEFERSVLGPQMASLFNKVEVDGFALYNQIPNHAGLPGTLPTDLQYFLDANATMAEFCSPQDDQVYSFMSPRTQSSMVHGLKGLFQDASEISRQYKKGTMGTSGGLIHLMSQNVQTHQTGTFSGTPHINGTTAEAATTIDVNDWGGATDTLKKGDIITIAGVYAVNPISKASTGQLMQFRVTANTTAAANEMATLPIDPPIYTSASGQLQNVDALPANDAAVYIFGAAATYSNKLSPANLVLHRDCLGFAACDLPMTTSRELQSRERDATLGLSIRLSRYWKGDTDDLLFRMDIMYGWAVLRDRFGCRVEG